MKARCAMTMPDDYSEMNDYDLAKTAGNKFFPKYNPNGAFHYYSLRKPMMQKIRDNYFFDVELDLSTTTMRYQEINAYDENNQLCYISQTVAQPYKTTLNTKRICATGAGIAIIASGVIGFGFEIYDVCSD